MRRSDFAAYCQQRAASWFRRALEARHLAERSVALEFAEGYYRNARQLMEIE